MLSLGSELVMLYMAFQRINNLWILHIYTLFEFIFILLIFSHLPGFHIPRRNATLLMVGYAVFWLSGKLSIESFTGFDSYTSPIANLILTVVGLMALSTASRTADVVIWKSSLFWFSIAVLVKFAGDFTIFLFGDWFVTLGVTEGISVWSLHWALNILSNIAFMLALACHSTASIPTGSS
jgi:hypothetical protein